MSKPNVQTEVQVSSTNLSDVLDKAEQPHQSSPVIGLTKGDSAALVSGCLHGSDQRPDPDVHMELEARPVQEPREVETKQVASEASLAEARPSEASQANESQPLAAQATSISYSAQSSSPKIRDHHSAVVHSPAQLASPKPHEETKVPLDESHVKAKKNRSRSPRSTPNADLTASDGSKFVLTKPYKKVPESSRYRCVNCKVEIQMKSIESHTASKSHQRSK